MKAAEPFYSTSHLQKQPAAQIISEAKASLLRPSRPFTPAPNAANRGRILIEPHPPSDSINHSFLRKFAQSNRLPTKLDPLEKPESPVIIRSLNRPKSPKSPLLSVLNGNGSRPSSPRHKEAIEDVINSDATLFAAQKSLDRSKSMAHLGELDKIGFEDSQSWKQLVKHVYKMVANSEIEPIYHYLESLLWLRKFHRPLSSKARKESKREGQTAQAFENQDGDQEQSSLEKKQRSALVKWLLDWSSDSESDHSLLFASCLLVRLTKDEEMLDTCLRKLFRVTMDSYSSPHPLVVRNLAWFCKQSQVKRKSNLLIYACGIFRNWSEMAETRHHIVSNDMIPFFTSTISQISAGTLTGQASQAKKSVEVALDIAEINIYARLISQVVVCLRNLNRNNELVYTPDLIQDLSMFLLKRNRMHEDDHVVLMIVKLLGTLSENPVSQKIIGQDMFVEAYSQLLIRFIDQPAILTRVAYILGNLTTIQSATHSVLAKSINDIVAVFGKVYEDYVETAKNSPAPQLFKVHIDLMIKMTRLVANLSLDKTIGDRMARMAELEPILDLASKAPDQELSLSIIWLLANVSFYSTPGSRIFTSLYLGIDKLIPHMISPNEEIVSESCRIIANLSRFPLPSSPKTIQRLMEVITLLLDHSNVDILHLACGILVNLLKGVKNIQYFIDNEGHHKLFDLLEWSLEKDNVKLLQLSAQGLYNMRRNIDTAILEKHNFNARIQEFPPQIKDLL